MCDHDGGDREGGRGEYECEILILPFPSISVLTHAVSHAHASATSLDKDWIGLGGGGALAPQRRERCVCSGNITPLRFVVRSCGSHTVPESDRRRRKRKMDITPYRFHVAY